MHHIWIHKKSSSTLKNFQELIEIIKLTPRVWNPNIKFNQTLRYITSTLNININIIGLKRSRDHFKCNHTPSNCYFPFYIFQNTLVKVLREISCFLPVNVVYFQGKYYLLLEHLDPVLIDTYPVNPVIYENVEITNADVIKILKNEIFNIPFNINLYTSYSYIRNNAIKIQSNIIAKYTKSNSNKCLHLFIAPHLEKYFNLHVLDNIIDNNEVFNTFNLFDTNFTEGNTHYNSKSQKEDSLNQEFCICDHSDTQRIFLSKQSSSNNLGILKGVFF